MRWIIKNHKGDIMTQSNGQWKVFDTAEDALREIESQHGNSPCLTPSKMIQRRL